MVKVDDLPEAEKKGNEESHNIADRDLYKNASTSEADRDAMELARMEAAEDDGDGDRSLADATPEERRAALAAQEAEGAGPSPEYTNSEKAAMAGTSMRLILNKVFGSKNKATGAMAAILFIFGIGASMIGGSSFWYSLEKNLTNQNANDTATNIMGRRAFNRLIGGKCGASVSAGVLCKIRTATKTQVDKWKDARAKVKGEVEDKDGNPESDQPLDSEGDIDPDKMKDGDRVEISEIDAPDGTRLTSANELNEYADANPEGATFVDDATESRTADFDEDAPFKEQVVEGENLSEASSEEPPQEEIDPNEAATEITEAEGKTDSIGQKVFRAMGGEKGLAALTAMSACKAYSAVDITVSAIKAKYAYDLLAFAWPFLQVISKTIAGQNVTDADIQKVEDRLTQLTQYMSPSQAYTLTQKINSESLTDDDKTTLSQFGITTDYDKKADMVSQVEDITGKSALDSQGLKMAFYGDNTGLTEMTKKFSTAAIGTVGTAAAAVQGWLRDAASFDGSQASGKQNIKTACIAVKAYVNGSIVANLTDCATETGEAGAATAEVGGIGALAPILKCLGVSAFSVGAWTLVGMGLDSVIKAGIGALVSYGLEKITLNSDLKGPAAGDALAAGVGLLLMKKAASSGLKPAMSIGAIDSFLVSTGNYTNVYNDKIAEYKARKTPFDINNQYSFVGQIANAFSSYSKGASTSTGFGFIADLFGAMSTSLLVPTANALHSQPTLLTSDQATLDAQTGGNACSSGVVQSNCGAGICPDLQKQDAGMMCNSSSGATINITSPRVIQWMKEDATGKTDHLADVIKWMQQPENHDEGQDASSGTNDQTCDGFKGTATQVNSVIEGSISFITQIIPGSAPPDFTAVEDCWDSTKASINPDGTTVSGSQFEKYLEYCTGKRKLDFGSTDIDPTSVSDRDAAWHDGTQCSESYDCNGVSSTDTDNKFNASCDTGNGSYMMDAFSYYYNMCYVQYAVANGATDCTNDSPPGGAQAMSMTTNNSGVCGLVNNPNITYVNPATKADLQKNCQGQQVTNVCGQPMSIDPQLANTLNTLSTKYKITVNNFGFKDDRDTCDSGEHPKGKAVDINDIEKLDGSGGTGLGITYGDPAKDKILSQFATDWINTLPAGDGGIGQMGCGGGDFQPTLPAGDNGNNFFGDDCNHLHVDVRGA